MDTKQALEVLKAQVVLYTGLFETCKHRIERLERMNKKLVMAAQMAYRYGTIPEEIRKRLHQAITEAEGR